ncbi:unnamed protein product [Schistosoma spindalis]|nr:unnamed protein product [Schistosoma spindale]
MSHLFLLHIMILFYIVIYVSEQKLEKMKSNNSTMKSLEITKFIKHLNSLIRQKYHYINSVNNMLLTNEFILDVENEILNEIEKQRKLYDIIQNIKKNKLSNRNVIEQDLKQIDIADNNIEHTSDELKETFPQSNKSIDRYVTCVEKRSEYTIPSILNEELKKLFNDQPKEFKILPKWNSMAKCLHKQISTNKEFKRRFTENLCKSFTRNLYEEYRNKSRNG